MGRRSANLVETRGARTTLLIGYVFLLAAFLWMLVAWGEDSSCWQIGLAYAFIGTGVGFAGTPASHSLTSAVPVNRAGMASGTADLQRDLGGAIMQSVFGALLTAGYASTFSAAIDNDPNGDQVSTAVRSQLTMSFASAQQIAEQNPTYASQITSAARQAFLDGDDWAYAAGATAILIGAVLVFFAFPRRAREQELLAAYQAEDSTAG